MKGTDPCHDNRMKVPCNVGDLGVDASNAGFPFVLEKLAWLPQARSCSGVVQNQPGRPFKDKYTRLPSPLPPMESSKTQPLFHPFLLS